MTTVLGYARKRANVLFLALALSAISLFGQDTTGKITGVITDPAGAVVPNVKVTVTNISTNIKHETTTNQDGAYQVLQLPISSYTVTALATGFEAITVQAKTALEINQTMKMDIQLQLGKVGSVIAKLRVTG